MRILDVRARALGEEPHIRAVPCRQPLVPYKRRLVPHKPGLRRPVVQCTPAVPELRSPREVVVQILLSRQPMR